MTNTLTFTCSICGEPSTAICAYCTKDSCGNHLCERCGRCSDCCECEVRLEEPDEAGRNGVPVLADQLDVVDDQPIADEVETAEEPRDEIPSEPEAADPVIPEHPEQQPSPIASTETRAEPALPETPPADRYHE